VVIHFTSLKQPSFVDHQRENLTSPSERSGLDGPVFPVPLFILHWNRPEECLRTVETFRAQNIELDLCVIDNHSEPEALRSLAGRLPAGVRLVKLSENKGWGGAFNVVMQQWLQSKGSALCFIAAHDAIPAAGCMELLVRAMEADPRIGIACPEYGTPEIPRFSNIRYYRTLPVAARPQGTSEAIDMPYGTLIGFRKDCIRAIGLFDERYFAYGDEHEIGLRARQGNWLVSVVWGAVVQNPGTWTASRTRSYLFARNSLLLVKTYAGWGWAALRLLLMLPNTLRMLIMPPDPEYAFCAGARMLAIRDFLLGRYGPPPK
jgi:N-acetylglucosaminyl-diphospho-decaprenol L-rhamnosyltransferase